MQNKIKVAPNRFHPDNTLPKEGWIFVFGSNEGGRHGKGAAKVAHTNFKAQYGVGRGRTGSAYAIPTKTKNLSVLPIEAIREAVNEFLVHARQSLSTDLFFITRIGCGLAGYTDDQIAPLFVEAPENCCLPEEWASYTEAARVDNGSLVAV